MATTAQNRLASMLTEEANRVRANWGWFLALGIVQIVAGMLAVSFAFTATLASVVALGILLLIAAGAQTAAAIWARDWGGFFLFLLLGVLYAVGGFLMLQHPLIAAGGLTLMLAAAFLVGYSALSSPWSSASPHGVGFFSTASSLGCSASPSGSSGPSRACG